MQVLSLNIIWSVNHKGLNLQRKMNYEEKIDYGQRLDLTMKDFAWPRSAKILKLRKLIKEMSPLLTEQE